MSAFSNMYRLDIPFFMAGILGSLVSITAICGVVRPGESLAIGFIGAAIAISGWQLLNKIKIDDPVGAISTHAGGSIWGMVAVGLFVEKDSLERTFSKTYGAFKGGHVKILGVQVLACVSITAWTIATVFIQLYIIDKSVGLRFPLEEEILGADVCEHGIDQSDIITEAQVYPVPTARNRIHPDPKKCNESNNGGLVDNGSLCEEGNHTPNGLSRSDGRSARAWASVYPAEQREQTEYSKPIPNLNGKACSSKEEAPTHRENFAVEKTTDNNKLYSSSKPRASSSNAHTGLPSTNGDRVTVSRSSANNRKRAPVMITITPADENREMRLSFSDLHRWNTN